MEKAELAGQNTRLKKNRKKESLKRNIRENLESARLGKLKQ